MGTFRLLAAYLITAVTFLAVDLLWLGFLARDFYRRHLGPFLADEVSWIPALLFYLLFPIGILVFAVRPALERSSGRQAFLRGALFGGLAYATYELTNLATLAGWPPGVAAVDIGWGALLTGTAGLVGYLALRRMEESRAP